MTFKSNENKFKELLTQVLHRKPLNPSLNLGPCIFLSIVCISFTRCCWRDVFRVFTSAVCTVIQLGAVYEDQYEAKELNNVKNHSTNFCKVLSSELLGHWNVFLASLLFGFVIRCTPVLIHIIDINAFKASSSRKMPIKNFKSATRC